LTRPDLSAEDYVVIGAFAAIAQGIPLEATHDVDVTPHRGTENLRRLSAALTELDARIRVDDLDERLVFAHDPGVASGMAMLNLTCPAGDLDVAVAGIEGVLRLKEEVGREKDARAARAVGVPERRPT
jgi:hypothetical protein